MICVALLRGINVGGNNKIEMSKLKLLFEKLGFEQVVTYINSGNVIFDDPKNLTSLELSELLEKNIETEFDLKIKVVTKNLPQIKIICEKIPLDWTNDKNFKTDVLFLWEEVDKPETVLEIKINPKIDNLIYIPGCLVWNIDKQNYNQSGMNKFIGTKIYKKMTVRNINTTRKILEIMEKLETRI